MQISQEVFCSRMNIVDSGNITHEFHGLCKDFFWAVEVHPITKKIVRSYVLWGNTQYPLKVTTAVSKLLDLHGTIRATVSYDRVLRIPSNFSVELYKLLP